MLNRKALYKQLVIKFGLSMVVLALLLFVPAGTLRYHNGWILLVSLLVLMSFALRYLLKHDPELLEKRLQLKERQKEQKSLMKAAWVFFLLVFVLPGLDYRFGWSHVPLWLVMAAVIILALGYAMFIEVMRENKYASRIIEVQDNQKIIDTGLYGVIRHPMYVSSLIIYLAMPLILGSWVTLVPIMICIPIIYVIRIRHEEKLLAEELAGYKDYTEKVKYRLIPLIW